jgi:hypothetical protein
MKKHLVIVYFSVFVACVLQAQGNPNATSNEIVIRFNHKMLNIDVIENETKCFQFVEKL